MLGMFLRLVLNIGGDGLLLGAKLGTLMILLFVNENRRPATVTTAVRHSRTLGILLKIAGPRA